MIDNPVRRPRLPIVGHAGRLKLHGRERLLLVGHLLVVGLALQDEEIVATLAETLGWGPRTAGAAEVGVSAAILVLWGVLTLAWVRCKRESGETGR